MRWTNEKPTKSGWYWMKDGSDITVVEIEIGTFDITYIEWVWQTGSRRQQPLRLFTAMQWAGPIPEPEDE